MDDWKRFRDARKKLLEEGRFSNEPSPLQVEVEAAVSRYDLADPEDRARALHAACKLIAGVEDDDRLSWVQWLAARVGVDVFTVNKVREHLAKGL